MIYGRFLMNYWACRFSFANNFTYPFETLIFNSPFSSHLMQRGERDCTTIGAFYKLAS